MHYKELKTIAELDAVIHNPARLMLFYLLSRGEDMDYLELMRITSLSSGNISTHLMKMQEAGYIQITKSFIGKKPNTSIRITKDGLKAYHSWGENILCALPKEVKQKKLRHPLIGFHDIHQDLFLMQSSIYKPAQYGRALPLPPMDGSLSL